MRVCLRLHVYRYCYCDIVAVRQPIGNIKAAWSGTTCTVHISYAMAGV